MYSSFCKNIAEPIFINLIPDNSFSNKVSDTSDHFYSNFCGSENKSHNTEEKSGRLNKVLEILYKESSDFFYDYSIKLDKIRNKQNLDNYSNFESYLDEEEQSIPEQSAVLQSDAKTTVGLNLPDCTDFVADGCDLENQGRAPQLEVLQNDVKTTNGLNAVSHIQKIDRQGVEKQGIPEQSDILPSDAKTTVDLNLPDCTDFMVDGCDLENQGGAPQLEVLQNDVKTTDGLKLAYYDEKNNKQNSKIKNILSKKETILYYIKKQSFIPKYYLSMKNFRFYYLFKSLKKFINQIKNSLNSALIEKCLLNLYKNYNKFCFKLETKSFDFDDLERFNWNKIARENQKIPKGSWRNWLILAGRGFGKTRTGAESIRKLIDNSQYSRIALIGQTIDEARGVMVEGVSGILSVYPPNDENYPEFESSKKRITWPNGAIAQIFGADRYDCLRGPQFDLAWVDEFAKFKYPEKTYEQLMLSLRLGNDPKCIITTTPRPINILKEILEDPKTIKTIGTTFDNEKNLPESFINYVSKHYGSSTFGRQELYGDILFEDPNSLWKRSFINYKKPESEFVKIVVAVDPAITYSNKSDETGIIVVGRCSDGTAYVMEDCSGRYHPNVWAEKVVQKYYEFNANKVVAEVNQGGDLVAEMIKSFDRSIFFTPVRATKGKFIRAEPVVSLYERKLIFHSKSFPELEDQMCQYIPGVTKKSPDRMDALVWGMTELFETELSPNVRVWHI